MEVVYLVLMGSAGHELDRVEMPVRDKEDCARETLAMMVSQRWVLSVGDRIELQATPE